jgi:hypothetical protein
MPAAEADQRDPGGDDVLGRGGGRKARVAISEAARGPTRDCAAEGHFPTPTLGATASTGDAARKHGAAQSRRGRMRLPRGCRRRLAAGFCRQRLPLHNPMERRSVRSSCLGRPAMLSSPASPRANACVAPSETWSCSVTPGPWTSGKTTKGSRSSCPSVRRATTPNFFRIDGLRLR